ncbi:MAG: glycoside hydrolase family 99-like domain-containing protein [Paracoccus sp. (in: a-proteobacteria)]
MKNTVQGGSARDKRKSAKTAASNGISPQTAIHTATESETGAAPICLLVLGMHRSGTSMLARLLNIAGFDLPSDLIGATKDNTAGHWEPVRFNDMNQALLVALDSDWHDWSALRLDTAPADLVASYRADLRAWIASERGAHDSLVLKEPRTCRIAPLVLAALDDEGMDSHIVIPFRNPIEVARSLYNRDGMPLRDGVLLWLRHVLDAECFSRGRPRGFVDYASLMQNPQAEMRRLGRDLKLDRLDLSETLLAETKGFISGKIRHHASDLDTLKSVDYTAGLALETYEALTALVADPASGTTQTAMDALRLRLDEIEHLTRQTQREDRHTIAATRQTLTQLEGQHRLMQSQLEEMTRNVSGIWELHDVVSELNKNNESHISDLRARLQEQENAARQYTQERDEARQALAQAADEKAQLVAHETQLQADLESSRALAHRLESQHQQDRQHQAEMAAQAQGAAEAQGLALEAAGQEIDQLQAMVDRYAGTVMALQTSTSWRVTAPMRGLSRGLRRLGGAGRRSGASMAKQGWQNLPIGQNRKEQIKDAVFPRLAFALGSTGIYQIWKQSRAQQAAIEIDLQATRAETPAQEAADAVLIEEKDCFVDKRAPTDLANPKARLIAFYLPQFHAIPENDEWWGEGFTEWTNVGPATPKFPGHYQPHEPVELGHYNLLDGETQARQIALAKRYGIGGFCFYWYWFAGHRLLEKPVENWLANPDLDFPFCICWANENWSRRWDGKDSELLIAQKHSPEDDLGFIAELAPYLRDPRYIRIDGKPLILLYRPSLLPNAAETAARWRQWCRQHGIGEIYLAYTQSFETVDPTDYGFDAAIEFPPNNYSPVNLTDRVPGLSPDFGGIVYDWRSYLERSRDYPMPDYKLIRSVCPAWDNTARRKEGGAIFANSNPRDYRIWLENAVTRTTADAATPDEKIIFVNAWNEWAEGAHLEPDTKYGYAYLEATRAGLNPDERPREITLVGHDAHPHGAQILLLNLARSYAGNGFRVRILLLTGGVLVDQYREYARVTVLDEPEPAGQDRARLLRRLRTEDGQIAIVNTTVSAVLLPQLQEAGYRTISLIHEMDSVYRQMDLLPQMQLVAAHADRVVFPAPIVQTHFEAYLGRPIANAVLRPQGLYMHRPLSPEQAAEHRHSLRAHLGVGDQTTLLLGVGYVDRRKGGDLFVRALAGMRRAGRDVRGIWIGHADHAFLPEIEELARSLGVADAMQFLGRQSDPLPYYAASDVFLLTSREDPYPSVVLEAMAAGLPCIMFGGRTGSEVLADRGLAIAVPTEDTAAMARAVGTLLDQPEQTARMIATAQAHIRDEGDFTSYSLDLLALSGRHLPKVSVIVPNYNYARYIEDRLASVVAQDYPIYEIIVLDDCSTDDSLARIDVFAAACDRALRVVPNQTNSGNVFRQWIRGVELARGDYIWIAEADDLARPDFLSTAMRGFERAGTVISYTDSAQIDENGRVLAENYRYYTDKVSPTHWAGNYVRDGRDEIENALYLKNTIPNVSGVVMQAHALADVLAKHRDRLEGVRFVGDWLVYLWMLERGGIAFSTESKNIHRRHQNSVTISNFDAAQLAEIAAVHKEIIGQYELGDRQQARARDYIDELAAQFGLTEETIP